MRHRSATAPTTKKRGVECSHCTDSEEFADGHEFIDRADTELRLRDWERRHRERFSVALAGRTPTSKPTISVSPIRSHCVTCVGRESA
jgi:hypothetical protein